MPASGQQRNTSRDGLRNKVEAALLSGFQPFWAFVNKTPWLARIANRLIVNNAVLKAPCRPLMLSTQAPYTNWATLTDRTWFSRYLPPAPAAGALRPLHPAVPEFRRITETVEDYASAAKLEMNPNRSPQCIKIPLATSPDHYASLGHARAIIYPGARAVRASVPPPQNN